MQLFFKGQPYHGFKEIISTLDGGLMKFALLKLNQGESYSGLSGNFEIALVILGGQANVRVNGEEYQKLGERANVFAGPAASVYIPIGADYSVEAVSGSVEVAVCAVEAEQCFAPFVVRPEEVVINHRGAHAWQRDVHDIITDNGDGRVDRIIVGETYGAPGNWSSFPPHKHDHFVPDQETELMEIYHFRLDPPTGFGVQVIYSKENNLDEAYLIRDSDSVNIPFGYHPVVTPPSVKVYYLWFLGGKLGRNLVPKDDADYVALRSLE